jgi:hypothetical protein
LKYAEKKKKNIPHIPLALAGDTGLFERPLGLGALRPELCDLGGHVGILPLNVLDLVCETRALGLEARALVRERHAPVFERGRPVRERIPLRGQRVAPLRERDLFARERSATIFERAALGVGGRDPRRELVPLGLEIRGTGVKVRGPLPQRRRCTVAVCGVFLARRAKLRARGIELRLHLGGLGARCGELRAELRNLGCTLCEFGAVFATAAASGLLAAVRGTARVIGTAAAAAAAGVARLGFGELRLERGEVRVGGPEQFLELGVALGLRIGTALHAGQVFAQLCAVCTVGGGGSSSIIVRGCIVRSPCSRKLLKCDIVLGAQRVEQSRGFGILGRCQ